MSNETIDSSAPVAQAEEPKGKRKAPKKAKPAKKAPRAKKAAGKPKTDRSK